MKWLALLGWLLITFAAAIVGSFFNPDAWYIALRKPLWNPPSWIFAPVWTSLYVLMGVAVWLVWQKVGWRNGKTALSFYIIQLILNGLWTYIFFGLHRPDLAFYEISLLWLFIALTLISFWRIKPIAGALLLPYIFWVSFAALLNFTLWKLNS